MVNGRSCRMWNVRVRVPRIAHAAAYSCRARQKAVEDGRQGTPIKQCLSMSMSRTRQDFPRISYVDLSLCSFIDDCLVLFNVPRKVAKLVKSVRHYSTPTNHPAHSRCRLMIRHSHDTSPACGLDCFIPSHEAALTIRFEHLTI